MGCGCSKTAKYVLVKQNGQESEHRSAQEAQAALVRSGGEGRIEKRVGK